MIEKTGSKQPHSTHAQPKSTGPSRELIETVDVVEATSIKFPPSNLAVKRTFKITSSFPHKTAGKATHAFNAGAGALKALGDFKKR